MVKLVTFHDAGDKPVYVNPIFVTFVERPAVGVFGNATIHFGGDQLTVKEEPEAVVSALAQSRQGEQRANAPVASTPAPGHRDVMTLPDGPATLS